VLLIEDNNANVKLLEQILESRPGVRLLCAGQGGLGLEMAREHRPDLILLDLHLPDMHGGDVLRRLLEDECTADLPVVILSADATPGQTERLLAAGARDYLTKPLDIRRFLAVLDQHTKIDPPST
jgi:CheY-like chemotaxis protein